MRGISQEQFALEAGFTRSYYAEIESGKRNVSLLNLYRIQEALQTSFVELLGNGDARRLAEYFDPGTVDFMITSPPYPGDHEYTRHTRLELLFMGYTKDKKELQVIKRRMLRGSTTNIYREDNERELVNSIGTIHQITTEIDRRLKEDNATSGFEKLYTKLIWEYFGGMHKVLDQAKKVMGPGGKFALLVSDSHAFKMVHIETAKILGEIAAAIGYSNIEIELWQDKTSSSHNYHIPENILILTK